MKKIFFVFLLSAFIGIVFSSCSKALETSSEMVEFVDDNNLNTPEDTLYSVMGIIRQMQVIADRTVLLGELRGDLMTTTDKATTDIKNLANFSFDEENQYNKISDYYAVINNCNYFLSKADPTMERLGKKIFEKEYAAVKAFRAWTYLQLAKIYGEIPVVTEPILTEEDAEKELKQPRYSITDVCNTFIEDLLPYVDTQLPAYGVIGNYESEKFFVPVRVLIGEMCLWAGRYQEAAQHFYNYLTFNDNPQPTQSASIAWGGVNNRNFVEAWISNSITSTLTNMAGAEQLMYIPMESSEFYGVRTQLDNIYNSTENNNYYCQAIPSKALRLLSASQRYVYLSQTSETQKDTIYANEYTSQLDDALKVGDLRLYGTYRTNHVNRDESSKYSSEVQTISKLTTEFVPFYRLQRVYLLFAEALCNAGYPESAFCILKYGLRNFNIERYISAQERNRAGSLLNFRDEDFTEYNTQGIHSRGCGNTDCDTLYSLPMPASALASYQDTVSYQIPLVQDMITEEMALESAFEGNRFFDLLRVALRSDRDASYLAAPISRRSGEQDQTLYNLLMEKKNWYLPYE